MSPQKLEVEKACAAGCDKYLQGYKSCQARFNQLNGETEKDCSPQYLDFWHCVDECAAPKLFAKLK